MRILFTTVPAAGHFQALVPLARALQSAGHDVAFATAASFRSTVEAASFRCLPAGAEWHQLVGTASPTTTGETHRRVLPQPGDPLFSLAQLFVGGFGRHMLPDLLSAADAWRPELLIRGSFEFSASVVGERLGIPYASVQTGGIAPAHMLGTRGGQLLNELRASAGLSADDSHAAAHCHLHLCPMPARYFVDGTMPDTTHHIQPTTFDRSSGDALPAWAHGLGQRPLVYVTLGTVANRWSHIFANIIAGIADEPIDVVITVGRDRDPSCVGPHPSNVHVERYVPNSLLLPLCDLAVMHGGYGSVMSALIAAVPLVLIPLFADQPMNARACERLGVAQVLPPEQLSPEQVRSVVRRALDDSSFRLAVRNLRAECMNLPPLEHAVTLLEDLAAGASLDPTRRPAADSTGTEVGRLPSQG